MSSAHSPTFPLLQPRHNSFSNPSVALPTSQIIHKPFVASPMSQVILQPFFRFSYATSSSLNSPGELHMNFIPLTSCTFVPPLHVISYHPLPHSWLGKNSWFGVPAVGGGGIEAGRVPCAPPLDSEPQRTSFKADGSGMTSPAFGLGLSLVLAKCGILVAAVP